MEVDFYRNLPHDTTLHVGRMYLAGATSRAAEQMLDRFAVTAAMALRTVSPDFVIADCDSATALRGRNYECTLSDRLAATTGTETVTVRSALHESLREAHVRQVTLVTPGDDRLTEQLASDLEASGIAVAAVHGLGVSAEESASIPSDEIYDLVRSHVGLRVAGDALLLAGTNVQAMGALSLLKMTYDIPIVTSNFAALQAVKRKLDGLRDRRMVASSQCSR
jgi:maleate cis-trans isomerase